MRLLVLCTHNSARSQMAEGWIRFHAHSLGLRPEVYSAGTEKTRVKPEAIQVMAEVGIDPFRRGPGPGGLGIAYARRRARASTRSSITFTPFLQNSGLSSSKPKRAPSSLALYWPEEARRSSYRSKKPSFSWR